MINPIWIAFDVGGVLFDHRQSFDDIQQAFGIEKGYIKKVIQEYIGADEKGSISLEQVFTGILEPIGKVSDVDKAISLWYSEKYWHSDTFKLMKELKDAGYHIAITTNNWKNMGARLRKIQGVEQAEKIYESAIIGLRKPSLNFYEYVSNDLHVDAAEIILIDDLKENCDGANIAGWQSFVYDMSSDHGMTSNDKLRAMLL